MDQQCCDGRRGVLLGSASRPLPHTSCEGSVARFARQPYRLPALRVIATALALLHIPHDNRRLPSSFRPHTPKKRSQDTTSPSREFQPAKMATAIKDLYGRLSNVYTSFSPPSVVKRTVSDAAAGSSAGPLRLGILGAANIAPPAVIIPARSHPDVIVSAVAARSKDKATAYAKKHGIPHVFDSYDQLINDPGIDVIYNPLPNGLHYEWTLKCIAAKKHVLLEKPSTANEADTKKLFEEAKKANVLVLEAFHYRFHPALHEYAYRLHDFMSPSEPLDRGRGISQCARRHLSR
ncbi:hypothetical protein L1887_54093 [Cichorium endivia]|nr:hypothetical protein L1887_54093 [Cichorium endivia]